MGLVLLGELVTLRMGMDAEDEGYFVEQATRVLRGQLPYRDFDSLYTPALLYLHAGVIALLGGSPMLDMRLVGWLSRVVLAIGLYLVCRPLLRPALAVLPSLFILIGMDRLPSTWEPHPAWPSAALTVITIGLALSLPGKSAVRRGLLLVVLGALTGLTFALKQNAGVLLGVALVVALAWQGAEPSPRVPVSRALRVVQYALLAGLASVAMWLLRPHASAGVLVYFLGPLLAAGLAAILPVQVATRRADRTRGIGTWLGQVAWLAVGFCLVSIPWLVVLLSALDWNLDLVKGFVGVVNQDVLWYPLAPPTGAAPSLVGIAVGLLALVRWRANPLLAACALVCVVVFGACMIILTRTPSESWIVGALLAPGRASAELSLYLPVLGILGGVWLSFRTASDGEAWWLRWMAVASAVTFLTEYPRVDEVHLTWSACLPLALGTVVVVRLYGHLVRRWRAGASRVAVAVALAIVPVMICLANLGVRSGGFVTLSSARGFPIVALPRLRLTSPPAAAGITVPTQQAGTLVAAAAFVDANTAPGEPIFVYPTSPLLYVLADRPNPTRFAHLYPGAATPAELNAVIDALARVNVVVVSESDLSFWGAPMANAPLEDYLANTYREVAEFGGYRVLQRAS